MGLNKQPPLVGNNSKPFDIIGHHYFDMFKGHCEIVFKNTEGDFPSKEIDRQFSVANRKVIAEIIERLSEHGLFVDGFDGSGNLVFKYILKSKSQMIFDEDIERHMHLNNAYVMKYGIHKAIGDIKGIG